MDVSVRDWLEIEDADVYEAADEITDAEIFENAMPNSPGQFNLMLKLVALLRYMYQDETCFVIGAMPIIPPRPRRGQQPYGFRSICPDVAVFKGVHIPEPLPSPFGSWRMRQHNRPAPDVVIEIASDKTWREDVLPNKKPSHYGRLGVKEYFACDPESFWRGYEHRLLGWRYQDGQRIELFPNEDGNIWSEVLSSDLRVENKTLNLYDEYGNLRKLETEIYKEIIANKDARIEALEAEVRKLRGEN